MPLACDTRHCRDVSPLFVTPEWPMQKQGRGDVVLLHLTVQYYLQLTLHGCREVQYSWTYKVSAQQRQEVHSLAVRPETEG